MARLTSTENTALYVVGWDVFRRRRVRPVLPAGSFEAKLARVEIREARAALGTFEGVIPSDFGIAPGEAPPAVAVGVAGERRTLAWRVQNALGNPGPLGNIVDDPRPIGTAPISGRIVEFQIWRPDASLVFEAVALRSSAGGTFFQGFGELLPGDSVDAVLQPDFVSIASGIGIVNNQYQTFHGGMPVNAGEGLFVVLRSADLVVANDYHLAGTLVIETPARVSRGVVSQGPGFDVETRETQRRARPPVVEREPAPEVGAAPGGLTAARDVILYETWEFPRRPIGAAEPMPAGYRLSGPYNAVSAARVFRKGDAVPEAPEPPRSDWVFTGYRPESPQPSTYSGFVTASPDLAGLLNRLVGGD